ncbi:MAG: arginine deiminase family protein [Candidatus Neomarinimicrobiota bacterium]|jgi:N-dimethylarginine dimethylaminohydrolase|nr:arginine deiminase family protein [Candidatus Neomarinimicrobiota bacterium]|tara:strand:+ start:1392 stop:2252 length:861 start_codon:yes stop_codon:yes gene_type:complete
MVDPIKKILLKHPRNSFINQEIIDKQYLELNYSEAPNFNKAILDYEKFVSLLKSFGIELHYLPEDNSTSLDSIYTHDPCIISNNGIIICNMGKKARLAEPNTIEKFFKSIQIPILGKIKAPGTLEGGDVVWIDDKTIAVGEGYRTNKEGIEQLRYLLSDQVETVISVPIPHWNGPQDCLHLMSNLSPIDHNLYLVYSRLLPVSFRKYLLDRNIELIDVPDEEYESMGCNVLTVAPRKAIMISGNSKTKQLLEKNNVEVYTYDGTEISIKGAGGPTCLTRPFLRISQ